MSTFPPLITPTHEYVVPKSIPMIGSPGSIAVALAAGIAARGQIRIRKKRRMPTPRGRCLGLRVRVAMLSLGVGAIVLCLVKVVDDVSRRGVWVSWKQ
jgi:hypothetical protein